MTDPLLALVRVLASSAGEAIVDGPEDRTRLVDLVRAEMGEPPTVGDALRVTHHIEYQWDGQWWQRTPVGVRWWRGEAGWSKWWDGPPNNAENAARCWLVPVAEADESPETRSRT